MTEPMRATTLDDLGEVRFDVPVNRPDGRTVLVPMRTLGDGEMWQIRKSITWPKPPILDFKKLGGEALPVYDYQDKGYLDAQREAQRDLTRRMLAAMLCLDIEGATLEDKAHAVENKIGGWAFDFLLGVVNKLNEENTAEIENAVNSFRRFTTGRTTGDDGRGFVAAELALLNESGTG